MGARELNVSDRHRLARDPEMGPNNLVWEHLRMD